MEQLTTLDAFALVLFLYLAYHFVSRQTRPSIQDTTTQAAPASPPPAKSIMSAPRDDLDPPKEDPFTAEQLAKYDGSDPELPIYVAVKGTIFDVTRKADMYGPGKSYNIFAGKDGSRGLAMPSLKPENVIADYSDLSERQCKVLNDWHSFFTKRYNIVGKVVATPATKSSTDAAP